MPVCCVSACWAGACACASAASATPRKSLRSLHSSQILIRHLLPNLISRCIPPAPLPRCCTRSIACGEGQCASPPPQVPLACLSQKIQAPPAGCHPPQLLVQSADWLLLPLSTGHWPLHDDGGGLGCRPMAAPATPAAVQAWGSTGAGGLYSQGGITSQPILCFLNIAPTSLNCTELRATQHMVTPTFSSRSG